MIAHVSAIFLLPVFEKSVIFNDFRATAQSISAREGGNTAYWKTVVRNRTVDDSVTYWFPWKHPMERRRGLEFGVFDQTPQKLARQLDPLFSTKLPQQKHLLGPSGLAICLFRRLCSKTQSKCGLGLVGLAFRALQMHQTPIFCSFDVCLAVLDMLCSTPTVPSVT